jgi:hypothetical protein
VSQHITQLILKLRHPKRNSRREGEGRGEREKKRGEYCDTHKERERGPTTKLKNRKAP